MDEEEAYGDEGIMWGMEPNLQWYDLPWHADAIHYVNGGHDNIVFLEVNVLAPKT